jgi:hypothetical protein
MLRARSVCVRRIGGGAWDQVMRFWRFLGNERVTVAKLIEGWSAQTRQAVRGRHVLAIQDSSDIKFSTTPEDRRGLGKVGKGNIFGVILHAMMAVDADDGACLGLAGGQGVDAQQQRQSPAWPARLGGQGVGALADHRHPG